MKMKPSLWSSFAVLLALNASAATVSIRNQKLVVSYEDTREVFSVVERASGVVFLKDGRLAGRVDLANVERAQDAVFGSGQRIALKRSDGSVVALELYQDLPFVLVCDELRNGSESELDVTSVVPASFTLDLGKPANELRTMGTAGLEAPDKNPGSYLFLTLADPATRRGVVTGYVSNDRGCGVLFSKVQDGQVQFRAQIDYGHLRLPPGGSARLEKLAIGIFGDARLGQERYADALAKQYHIKLHPQLAGYCTWYSQPHGGAADEKSIVELAEFAAKELKPFGFSFVQIDDEWQDGGKYNGPRRGFDRVRPDGPYPHGMKPVADRFKELGLTAGIWFLPFARNHQDPEYQDRQDWFMKRPDGKPFETAWGGTSLDLTQPAVQAHLTALVKTIHGWGYNYFKMDGLWTGSATEQIYVNDGYQDDHMGNNAPFHNPRKTNVEVLRDGLKLLRQAAGSEVFFSGCNVSQNMRSLGGCLGLVDSMRIGPDNGQGWRDYHDEILKNQSGALITGPVRGTRLYFLHGRTWWNDPDPSYVRASVPLSQARLLTSWVALSGQFNLNSDWIPGLPAERLEVIKRTMPHHGATARPVDYFDTIMPGIWLVSDTRQSTRRDVLGLFNWESTNQTIAASTVKAGLDPVRNYYGFDFWGNAPVASFGGEFKFDVPAQSCRVIAVRATAGHPVLVSTSRHVTQGMVDVTGENWRGSSQTLSGASQIVGSDPYELRVAGLNEGGKHWKLIAATIAAADLTAGVSITPKAVASGEAGWLRVLITSGNSRNVKWRLKFALE
jgi:hypothetical protein